MVRLLFVALTLAFVALKQADAFSVFFPKMDENLAMLVSKDWPWI